MISDQNQWIQTLRMAGCTDVANANATDIALLLRQAYVRELLGDRRYQYEEFVSHML